MPYLSVGGRRLEYLQLPPPLTSRPTLVLLHQGLGALAMWESFGRELARESRCGLLMYSRLGYGRSDPLEAPFDAGFMHHEALEVLPAVLGRREVRAPILVGHSDGASIAVIYTGRHPAAVEALVLEAPHVFVEPVTLESIRRLQAPDGRALRHRLARYHGSKTDQTLDAWVSVWLSPEFRSWNIEAFLPAIHCPVLVVQGDRDEYGSEEQLRRVARGVSGPVEVERVPGCGHQVHREAPGRMVDAICGFVRRRVEGKKGLERG